MKRNLDTNHSNTWGLKKGVAAIPTFSQKQKTKSGKHLFTSSSNQNVAKLHSTPLHMLKI